MTTTTITRGYRNIASARAGGRRRGLIDDFEPVARPIEPAGFAGIDDPHHLGTQALVHSAQYLAEVGSVHSGLQAHDMVLILKLGVGIGRRGGLVAKHGRRNDNNIGLTAGAHFRIFHDHVIERVRSVEFMPVIVDENAVEAVFTGVGQDHSDEIDLHGLRSSLWIERA